MTTPTDQQCPKCAQAVFDGPCPACNGTGRKAEASKPDVDGAIEAIRARASASVTEIVANPREYFRFQQVLQDRAALLSAYDAKVAECAAKDARIVELQDESNRHARACATAVEHLVKAEADNARLREALQTMRAIGRADIPYGRRYCAFMDVADAALAAPEVPRG